MKAINHHYRTCLAILAVALGASVCLAGQGGGPGFSFGDPTGKNEACLSCHGDEQKVPAGTFISRTQYSHTTHSELGCVSCHGVDAGHPRGERSPKADCRDCHTEISQEYAQGIHVGKTGCAGCHDPHRVVTPKEISGEEINRMCSGCHEGLEMVAKHGEWLPQADLHIRMLPCITCHTGSKEYFVSMYIVKGEDGTRFGRPQLAGYEELKKLAPQGDILALLDGNGDQYVSLTELRDFNKNRARNGLYLKGMMTPAVVSHRFEILDDRRNCTFCHASGPGLMQTSYISLPKPNGTFTRVAVERGAVLDALYGTPDFYLMGSTKSTTLNYVGLALICSGMILPVGHGTLRFLTRKNRTKKEH